MKNLPVFPLKRGVNFLFVSHLMQVNLWSRKWGGGILKTHAAKMSCNDDEFVKLYLNRVRCIIYLLNFFVYFKDTRDVPQFQIIFLDRIFLFYLHLNLFMPKNSGCINRLILSLNTMNFSFKSMKNTIKCFMLKLKYIFSIETIYIHIDKYNITWKCWNNVVEIFTLDRETNGPRASSLSTTAMMKSLLWGHIQNILSCSKIDPV